MALLLKNDAVFLHVPKTGGNWVARVLSECNLLKCQLHGHSDMNRVLNSHWLYPARYLHHALRHGPLWNLGIRPAFKFCFVRHPITWYESAWNHLNPNWKKPRRRWNGRQRWNPVNALIKLGDTEFNKFMRNLRDRQPGFVTRMFDSYTAGQINFIGRQETLTDDMVHVLRVMNVDFDEQRVRETAPVNVRSSTRSPVVWDEDLRRDVEQQEQDGLMRYGYLPRGAHSGNSRNSRLHLSRNGRHPPLSALLSEAGM